MALATAGGLSLVVAPSAFADTGVPTTPSTGVGATTFSVGYPGTASCPTATSEANGDRVYSFVVDSNYVSAGNLDSMVWTGGVPTYGNYAGVVLFNGTTPYVSEATQPPASGQTSGELNPSPTNFSWAHYHTDYGVGDDLYPGTFYIGVACTTVNSSGQVVVDGSNVWYSAVTFTGATYSTMAWSTVTPSPSTPEVPLAIALPVGGLVILMGGGLLVRRRSHRTA